MNYPGYKFPYKYIAFFFVNRYLKVMTKTVTFEWDAVKNQENIEKHGVSFAIAQYAFSDNNRIILKDLAHSLLEERYYCIGKIQDGIITVRFTYREHTIRIFGAGFWRKGKKIYEEENKIYE